MSFSFRTLQHPSLEQITFWPTRAWLAIGHLYWQNRYCKSKEVHTLHIITLNPPLHCLSCDGQNSKFQHQSPIETHSPRWKSWYSFLTSLFLQPITQPSSVCFSFAPCIFFLRMPCLRQIWTSWSLQGKERWMLSSKEDSSRGGGISQHSIF